jgi:hypothetical protein
VALVEIMQPWASASCHIACTMVDPRAPLASSGYRHMVLPDTHGLGLHVLLEPVVRDADANFCTSRC